MNTTEFRRAFWDTFGGPKRNRPHCLPVDKAEDLCPDVRGLLSLRKQRLLNLAFGFLAENEAYFEVGTYQGQSLISAQIGNAPRPVYAAEDFSQFPDNEFATLWGNLTRYGMDRQVTLHSGDFRTACNAEFLRVPVGLYFYDGAHDLASQHEGIALVEPFLADEALVLVDDWRHDYDSLSYAKPATLEAMRQSANHWRLLYELPARYNGDLDLWWNGVGVLAFRRAALSAEAV